MAASKAELVYQITCEDVRLEIGNKVSLMGVFQEMFFQRLPAVLNRIAVVSQWRGEGDYTSEIRILSPDRVVTLASSQPTAFQVPKNGYANNVNFFINLHFERPGNYIIQTFVNSELVAERTIAVAQVEMQNATAVAATDNDSVN
ncbi:MAG: hypothetical protein JNN15_20865 [Blastocatellia bacterium]|nr:hypothetical protein [Blastocatellia bacterium]